MRDDAGTRLSEPPWAAAGRSGAVAGRYEIAHAIGRGGMAQVYSATDLATGKGIALKQLSVPEDARHRGDVEALFEREYHTLAELAHPSIIEVYDYGHDDFGPFYTMELLDGADLREQSPLGFRDACALLHDVCSSLALIHSRRLVHRDVSPRNVRCTANGRAKLIDFGAMVPMGRGASAVGTPSYLAPEVLYRSSLDARTDLFSLGATLYCALTGRPAYPSRDFGQLPELWKARPPRPSMLVSGIPEALDALVLSLLSIDPANRPRSAGEVMQRLVAIASLDRPEPAGVSKAYLATPVIVGRDETLASVRHEMERAVGGRSRTVLVRGAAGLGRSRLLDACVLLAKTYGAIVVRADADSTLSVGFSAGRAIAEQLLDALFEKAMAAAHSTGVEPVLFAAPDVGSVQIGPAHSRHKLKDLTAPDAPRFEVQTALVEWILEISAHTPLAIAVDDFHRLDEPSASFLASLASRAQRNHLAILATIDPGGQKGSEAALTVLNREAVTFDIAALTRKQTADLVVSLFGDVPNVRLVASTLHDLCDGNPRACMDVAQHLVDTGCVSYGEGVWTLPIELDPDDLPENADAAILARVNALSPLARRLAEIQSLASHTSFVREDYARVAPDPAADVDRAITELLSQGALVSDGRVYTVAHIAFGRAFTDGLSDAESVERHRALTALYGDERPLAHVRHLLAAGLHELGLERLLGLIADAGDFDFYSSWAIDPAEMAPVFERALEIATELRGERQQQQIRRWLVALSVVANDEYYTRHAPAWFARLEIDSGLSDYRALGDADEPSDRLSRAMQTAYARYGATPEGERVYRPDEAIRGLALYVAVSIAVGARSQDGRLLESLRWIVEPYAAISPILASIHDNAVATYETVCLGKLEQARARWLASYERLKNVSPATFERVDLMRRAVAYGIGAIESRFGLASTGTWADLLDQDPLQKVNAAYLRKIFSLHRGDWERAEQFRRRAEVLALEAPRQMFASSPIFELPPHCLAEDLTGVKQILDRLEPLAERYEGYRQYRDLAEGFLWKISGKLELAKQAFESVIRLSEPIAEEPWRIVSGWPRGIAGLTEVLMAMGRVEDAQRLAEDALAKSKALGIGMLSHEIARALALAEAKLGDLTGAASRLEALIDDEIALGVGGLNLGTLYETRTRVAIWAGDQQAIEEFARCTAREYRHGSGSALGARYERLVDEAGPAISGVLPDLSDFQSSGQDSTRIDGRASASAIVTDALRGAHGSPERLERALTLLCDAHGTNAGHLYLFGDTGLELVASRLTPSPPAGLRDFAADYAVRAIEQSYRTRPREDVTDREASWAEIHGFYCCALLLADHSRSPPLVAGVAVLLDRRHRERVMGETLLAAAVGAALIRQGDAQGVLVHDDSLARAQ